MKLRQIYLLAALIVCGCASQEVAKNEEPQASPASPVLAASSPDTLTKSEIQSAVVDSSFYISDSNYDKEVLGFMETAHEHYVSAVKAGKANDTVTCANEFEYAIANLNELANFPGIDSNRQFTALSKNVLEDYEKFISTATRLGPNASVFALREKINQMVESTDSTKDTLASAVIKTTSIPLVINGLVTEDMNFLRDRFHDHFQTWINRSGKYFPRMKRIFEEEGVPPEMVFLTFVESGVNPSAHSFRSAVGMWQFMKGTGKLYGLSTSFWCDERCDVDRATRAAARHFRDLHEELGDWYLALAAYDAGAGRVYRAERRSGTTDYWQMRRYLPRETRNYVPLYISATVMGLDPKTYGFETAGTDTLAFDEAEVSDCVNLQTLATCAGTDLQTMRELNPALIRGCTPPGGKSFKLRIPVGTGETFAANYSALPDDAKKMQILHTVGKKENLATIARKYGISRKLLAEANSMKVSKKLTVGSTLVVPIPSTLRLASLDENDHVRKSKKQKKTKATAANSAGAEGVAEVIVKKGDSLGKIAAREGVSVAALKEQNDLGSNSIRASKRLEIPQRPAKRASTKTLAAVKKDTSKTQAMKQSYTVKKGDTLYAIASIFGVSVGELKVWNKIRGTKLKIGQELKIIS